MINTEIDLKRLKKKSNKQRTFCQAVLCHKLRLPFVKIINYFDIQYIFANKNTQATSMALSLNHLFPRAFVVNLYLKANLACVLHFH